MTEPVLWVIVVGVPLVALVGLGLYDLIWRHPETTAGSRFGWAVVIVLVPFIGILAYALLRPPPPASGRAARDSQKADVVQRIERLIADHEAGVLSDEQFGAAKRELFGLGHSASQP